MQRGLFNLARMVYQIIGTDAPVNLHAACKAGHGIRFDAHASEAQFFTLDERCSGAAEGVQHAISPFDTEPIDIGPDEVRREGKHEPVPIVYRAVLRPKLVLVKPYL